MKFGRKLEFISFIKRDGSGIIPVGTEWNTDCDFPKTDDMTYLEDEKFKINTISLSCKTFIASGFNTWVVRLK